MEKLKGIDLFLFKAYIEPTHDMSAATGVWKLLTEMFVNLFFALVNMIVFFFSTIMKALEEFSAYDLYRKQVYDFSKTIWGRLVGSGSGVANNSIIFTLIALSAIYLFFQWALSRGDFSRKVLHLLMVIGLSFAWFGTINATKGGLYILDGIRGFSAEAVKSFNDISFEVVSGEKISANLELSENYIQKTSYEAYLFVNTGRIDGKFYNQKTEELEDYPTDVVLGKSDGNGHFVKSKNKDIEDKLQWLGDGALDDNERNRWNSAVGDHFSDKLLYVLSTMIEAVVLPVPYLMIQLIRIISEFLVLLLIIVFPIGVLLSFIPRFQDLMFGFVKAFFVTGTVPSFATLMVFCCSLVDKFISIGLLSVFLNTTEKQNSATLMVTNVLSAIMSALIYYFFWKYKAPILSFFAGSYGSTVNQGLDNSISFAGDSHRNVQHLMNKMKNRSLEASPEEYVEVVERGDRLYRDVTPEVDSQADDVIDGEFTEREERDNLASDDILDGDWKEKDEADFVDEEEKRLDDDVKSEVEISHDDIEIDPSNVVPESEQNFEDMDSDVYEFQEQDAYESQEQDVYESQERDVYERQIESSSSEFDGLSSDDGQGQVKDMIEESSEQDSPIIEEVDDIRKGALIEEVD